MAMLPTAQTNPIVATVRLSTTDLRNYVISALGRLGFSEIYADLKYDSLCETISANVRGTRNGKIEHDTIDATQIRNCVIAELQRDGHQLQANEFSPGMRLFYGKMTHSIEAECTLLVPRKLV